MQEAPQGTTAELSRTGASAASERPSPPVRHRIAWTLTALLGALWLIGTLGSERIEPPLREVVSQFEVWRGFDVARGPLDENFNDTSPKADKDSKNDKSKTKPASKEPKAKATPKAKAKPKAKTKPTPAVAP